MLTHRLLIFVHPETYKVYYSPVYRFFPSFFFSFVLRTVIRDSFNTRGEARNFPESFHYDNNKIENHKIIKKDRERDICYKLSVRRRESFLYIF